MKVIRENRRGGMGVICDKKRCGMGHVGVICENKVVVWESYVKIGMSVWESYVKIGDVVWESYVTIGDVVWDMWGHM